MNLIITPIYRSYHIVLEMCQAIDKYTVNPYLHILVDDDSGIDEPFPVKPASNRRIIMLKRDYSGIIHKNGGGQAIQLGLCYAHQKFFNEKPNPIYDNVFLIEADVIVKEDWDKKMLEIKETLPKDWASLDCQSVDKEGKLTYPTTISPRKGFIREDLEHMEYCDFQCSLFNQEIFKENIRFSDSASHFDITWSKAITETTGKQHYRTTKVEVMHYFFQSRQFLSEVPKT